MAGPDPGVSFSAAIPDVEADSPFTFGGIPICAEGKSITTIVEVTAIAPDLRVAEWTLRPLQQGRMLAADGSNGLREMGYAPGVVRVDAACPEPVELAVELRRASAASATSEGLEVSYVDGQGNEGTWRLPFTVTLCAPGDQTGICDM